MYILVVFDHLQDEAALNTEWKFRSILTENTRHFEHEANSVGGHSV